MLQPAVWWWWTHVTAKTAINKSCNLALEIAKIEKNRFVHFFNQQRMQIYGSEQGQKTVIKQSVTSREEKTSNSGYWAAYWILSPFFCSCWDTNMSPHVSFGPYGNFNIFRKTNKIMFRAHIPWPALQMSSSRPVIYSLQFSSDCVAPNKSLMVITLC